MNRVWCYRPELPRWLGLRRTFLPVAFGGDEFNRHTLVLGWALTGQVVIAYAQCCEDETQCLWYGPRPTRRARLARALLA